MKYEDNSLAYTLAVSDLKVGDIVQTSRNNVLDIKPGNRMIMKNIPAGITICNIELSPGSKASVVRSAGSNATVLSNEAGFVQVKMPSSEIRKFNQNCLATIGQVSNVEWNLVRLGKAGRRRWLGRRSIVRGVVKNPVDHPHGGGEGRSGQGNPHPVTPWGKPTKGGKTRKPKKKSSMFIVKRRERKRRKRK